MDFNISGKKAIVCGASKGLGFECARALTAEGVDVLLVARNIEGLERAVAELAELGAGTTSLVVADVVTAEGRAAILAAQPQADILVTNCGGPPPGDFRNWSRDDWINAVDANMLSPIELIKMLVDGMIDRSFGRIVNITSSAVKSPIPVLGLSNGARAGLTGFVAGLARDIAKHNVTINNLLPGPFETARLSAVIEAQANMQGRELKDVKDEWVSGIPAAKFGDPHEFGQACVFLAGMSHMTGQNILLDGGQYPGTF